MRETLHDADSGVVTTLIRNDFGASRDRTHGLVSDSRMQEAWSIHPDDPLSASVTISWQQKGGRDDWTWSTDVEVQMHVDATCFYLEARVTALEGSEEVFCREYRDTIERQFV